MDYWEKRRHEEKIRSINEAEKVIAQFERDIKNMGKELEKEALAILDELGGEIAQSKRILTKAASEQSLDEYYRLVGLATRAGGDGILKVINHPVLQFFLDGDESGSVDIDTLADELSANIDKYGSYAQKIPLVGTIEFDSAEVAKIVEYIKKEGEA